MKLLITVLMALTIAACGKAGDSASGSSKSIFSLWTNSSNSNMYMDLSGRAMGVNGTAQFMFDFHVSPNWICNCRMTMSNASNSGGDASLDMCIQSPSGPFNCSQFNGNYTFTNVSSSLMLCVSGGACSSYQ